ncbi:MAG: GTP-binding protein [Candidatus Kariarchaeaceae archaeon]|jgi:small GTP-binding protein
MSKKNPDFTFKILLLGDGGVGKTSLVQRFVHDRFTKEYLHTIGMQPSQKYMTVDNKFLCLSIFDIAGDKSFKGLRELFYRGARGSLVTFDLTDKGSFNNAEKWLKEAKSKSKNQHFILVGNKNDLKNRAVSAEDGKTLAKKLKCSDYIETSALNGDFVDKAFTLLGETILRMNL